MDRSRHKFLASATCRPQGVRACSSTTESVSIDRFSNLPDHVAHHILSFIAITDLTRFGCASKRCRQLYLSTPSLNFEFSGSNISTRTNLSSLNRFLMHRGVNKIQVFHICFPVFEIDHLKARTSLCRQAKSRMITWIDNAVKCNVEVLHLESYVSKQKYKVELLLYLQSYVSKEPPLFPSSVFLCGSLRFLCVEMSCKIPEAPSLASFSNLEFLRFHFVTISDEGIFKWISCCCKCIKELHLDHVNGIQNVTIESSSLKSFSFEHTDLRDHICHLNISGERVEEIHIDWQFDSSNNKSLNILAPNLKYLKLEGSLSTHQNLGKLMCLEKAELLLVPEADELNILFKVFCSIGRAEVLILNKETTMALFKGGSMPASLENVCYLCMHVGSLFDSLIPAMVSLFGGMPNLSTLDIKSYPLSKADCSGFDMGYWKLQNLAFIDQLKEVTIELSYGSNGIEFARYILVYAQNLKKMVIVHSPEQSNATRKLNISKMTTNATLVFQEDPKRSFEEQGDW